MDVNDSTNPTSSLPSLILRLRDADVQCSKIFLQELDEKQLLQQVCQIWVETGGFRMAGFVYAHSQDMIGPMLYAGNQHEISPTGNPSPDQLALQEVSTIAIRTGQSSCIGDVLSLPVQENDRLFGALTLRASQAGQFASNAVNLLTAFSRFLARELAGLQTRRQRKEIEETLKNRESGIRQLIDAIPQHILINAPNGLPLFANKAWVDYHGQSLEQMQSMGSALENVHPDDVERLIVETTRGYSGKTSFQTEFRIRRKDGQYRWFLFRLNPLEDQHGNIVRWYSSATDIENLKNAEQQWRDVFENNPTMYFMMDASGTVMAVNPYGAEQLGYTVDELVERSVLNVFYKADHQEAQQHLAECLENMGKAFSWEMRKVRKDGSMLWVRETARAVMRGDQPVVLVACEDITERKNAEKRIREQEIELRQILSLAPQLIFVEDQDGNRLYANQAALDYYGFTLEEWRNSDRSKVFYPGDWERISREVADQFVSGQPHEAEGRLLRKDGKYRWFLLRRNPFRDELGRVVRWYVAGTDIDDRKQAEERLHQENVALREDLDKASMFEEIVGASPALKKVLSQIAKVAPTHSSVLITGETGTGKELVARAIHRLSRRSTNAFISVNCAAIPRDLIASELFGHEKGAFTGAIQRRLGRFELAEGGTIFFDEIGELPPETQVALLRVLQEHEFERVGGTKRIAADVRVIAATNRDLQSAVASGAFRRDLFYRLNVFPIEMPPLRERKEDIRLLVEYYVDRFAREAGKSVRGVGKKTLELFESYSWPGNIRELQNVIERSVIVCESETFSIDESWFYPPSADESNSRLELPKRLDSSQEREIIEAALQESGGRVSGASGAAAKLGIPGSTLESKIKALKINKSRFKKDPSTA